MKKPDPKRATVKVAGAISDGKGGYLPKGAALEGVSDATLASLKAKGLAE